jgi:large subunit ribosomal protein L13
MLLDSPHRGGSVGGVHGFSDRIRPSPGDRLAAASRAGVEMNRQTFHAKTGQVNQQWLVIDATDQVLGRLSTKLATILMGKHKPIYTPHVDTGDFVIVTNVDKLRMTGSKADIKFFQTYSGYTSGQKNYSYRWMLEHKPELLLERSVRRMLPKTKMGKAMLTKLKMYRGAEHPHQAQMPLAMAM